MQGLDDPRLRAGLQVNFILYVLLPWWSNVARLMPELQPMLDELRANREYYDGISAGTIPPPRDTLDHSYTLPTMAHPTVTGFRPGSAGSSTGGSTNAAHAHTLQLSSLTVNTNDGGSMISPRPTWPSDAVTSSNARTPTSPIPDVPPLAIRVTASDGSAAALPSTSTAHPPRRL
jgi:hypothetical protein